MISISLCMIVRDEEQTLGRCLDSVKAAAGGNAYRQEQKNRGLRRT